MKVMHVAGVSLLAASLAACNSGHDQKDAAGLQQMSSASVAVNSEQFVDKSDGSDWPAFGRTYGEQHYSPLDQVNDGNVGKLGLAWSLDLPVGNSATGPIEVGGTIFMATGYSVVRAVDVVTGKLLWTFDPHAPEAAGPKMRNSWGSRGIAYWNGKVYTGTVDGRLIAIDAKTGAQVWSVDTFGKDDPRFITGAPRVFDGKIIIGNGGADTAATRGYVTTYDAETGKQLWRFFIVPGNPANGFEDEAMQMAATTWSGEWWKYGGGGNAWNAMSYDPETDTIMIGTGNGSPWNWKIRSQGKGDNLFLCSIVALDAKTGKYKWHYQFNPGESWDFNATMDMELADLKIDGQVRKVVMTAPKNGFFYVIDRTNGKLISAKPYVDVTWARSIDLHTGRPVQNPDATFPNGKSFTMKPAPVLGSHSWMPMAYSPQTRYIYIPTSEMALTYDDRGIDLKNWQFKPGMYVQTGTNLTVPKNPGPVGSSLVAWDPVTQKQVWRLRTPAFFNGGLLATAGNLLFQGQIDSTFNAYDAKNGKRLWSYDAKAPILGVPISYRWKDRQYVTIITGYGTSAADAGDALTKYNIQYRNQARRVLTFAIGGKATLPPNEVPPVTAVDDPDYKPDAALAQQGVMLFGQHCLACHGANAVAAGNAPDLRASGAILDAETFQQIVQEGGLVPAGMPRFGELRDPDLQAIRQYLRGRADDMRKHK